MTAEQLKKRKKTICELINSDFYVPMKIKELAIFMEIPKEQRAELQEVLDALLLEGKIEVSQKGKYSKRRTSNILWKPQKLFRSTFNCCNSRKAC